MLNKGTLVVEGSSAITWHPEHGWSLLVPTQEYREDDEVPEEILLLVAFLDKMKNNRDGVFIGELLDYAESIFNPEVEDDA